MVPICYRWCLSTKHCLQSSSTFMHTVNLPFTRGSKSVYSGICVERSVQTGCPTLSSPLISHSRPPLHKNQKRLKLTAKLIYKINAAFHGSVYRVVTNYSTLAINQDKQCAEAVYHHVLYKVSHILL